MINDVSINVFEAPVEAVFHQANCFHTMGSGIARTIRREFPDAYEADLKTPYGDKNKLGTFSFAKINCPYNKKLKYIFNLYGQWQYGREKRHTNYDALHNAFYAALRKCQEIGVINIGVPYKIGCNLGGGTWEVVEKMIVGSQISFPSTNIYICKFDPPVEL